MNVTKTASISVGLLAITVLSACQQTPRETDDFGGARAAYSEWDCQGEPVLTQFYGARVVISDATSSRWLDRGTQVGQVFRADGQSVHFRDDSLVWTQGETRVTCEPRTLPSAWLQAAQQRQQPLHFVAEGPQQSWVFRLEGQQAYIEAYDVGGEQITRRLPAGEGDYYLDMWTFNIQTAQDRMRIEITDGLCRHYRDQIPYPSSIQINWNDQVLQGCGRWLAKSGYRP